MTAGAGPRVVIGFDGSDVAAHAIAATGRLVAGARATVVVVRESWLPLERAAVARLALPDAVIAPATRALDDELVRTADELVDRGRELAVAAGLSADGATEVAATPWRGLVAAARHHDAAAIVCGASGRGGLPRALLGTTTDALVHHAPVPVLVVPAGDGAFDGPALIGYDRSEPAREAVRDAALLFADRRWLVVHAWSSPIRTTVGGANLLETPVDEVQQLAKGLDDMYAGDAEEVAEEGASLAREHGLDATSLAIDAPRATWRALDAAAEERRAAVIVVGSRGRGALAAGLLGSVSSGLVHNARRPVLVTRRAAPPGTPAG